jgi:predicted nucleic acid-binding protein
VIFLDTGLLVSLFNKRDRDYPRVLAVFRSFEGKSLPDLLLTTDHVVFETITFLVRQSTAVYFLSRWRVRYSKAAVCSSKLVL